ncbi:GIY-YIG nuclease family protein [Pedobacter sandarakinus]
MMFMYYLYILHSSTADKYYVGYTSDYLRRLDMPQKMHLIL